MSLGQRKEELEEWIAALHEEYATRLQAVKRSLDGMLQGPKYWRLFVARKDPKSFMRSADFLRYRGFVKTWSEFEKRVLACTNGCVKLLLDDPEVTLSKPLVIGKPQAPETEALTMHFYAKVHRRYDLGLWWIIYRDENPERKYSEIFLARICGLDRYRGLLLFPHIPIRAYFDTEGNTLTDEQLRYFSPVQQREMQSQVVLLCQKLKEKVCP